MLFFDLLPIQSRKLDAFVIVLHQETPTILIYHLFSQQLKQGDETGWTKISQKELLGAIRY